MSDQSRRKLLKSIASGSGVIAAGKSLPESWSRPFVNSVILPAHAQTSGAAFTALGIAEAIDENEILDLLVPSAQAGGAVAPSNKNICFNTSGNNASVQVTVDGDPNIYTGNYMLPFPSKKLTPSKGDGQNVYINGQLSGNGEQIFGVLNVGNSATKYSASKSGASCSLSSSATCAPVVYVPSISANCSDDSVGLTETHYYLDDLGSCPVLRPDNGSAGTTFSKITTIRDIPDATVRRAKLSILGPTYTNDFEAFTACATKIPDSIFPIAYSVIATSGATWKITGEGERNVTTGAFIRNIILTR